MSPFAIYPRHKGKHKKLKAMESFFNELATALIPVSIVVVLPVMIVWLVMRAKINRDNKNAEVLMKAVENNSVQDVDKILDGLRKPAVSAREVMLQRLLRGCAFFFVGIPFIIIGSLQNSDGWTEAPIYWCIGCVCAGVGLAYLIVYFVSRNLSKSDKD